MAWKFWQLDEYLYSISSDAAGTYLSESSEEVRSEACTSFDFSFSIGPCIHLL